MAGTLNVTFELVADLTSGRKQAGQRQTPYATVSLAGDVASQGMVVAAKRVSSVASYTPLYRYAERGSFEFFAAWLPKGGYVQLAIKTDIPTSASDLSQSGTGRRWTVLDLASHAPFILTSDQLRTTTTANIADWYGPTGSDAIPTLLNSVNAVNGKIYEIGVSNPSDDDDVTVEYLWGN